MGAVFEGQCRYLQDPLSQVGQGTPAAPQIVPIGLAVGSQSNLIFASDAMLKAVGGETRRVIPVHEDRLKTVFPSRLTKHGQQVVG